VNNFEVNRSVDCDRTALAPPKPHRAYPTQHEGSI